MTPALCWADYMATGSSVLALAYFDQLLNNTKAGYVDSTGLVGPVAVRKVMGSHGNHIGEQTLPGPSICDSKQFE